MRRTTSEAIKLLATVDRSTILADGKDLSFITIQVSDKEGMMDPRSNHEINFSIEGPGEIVAIDNGDPTSMVSFSSLRYKAFNGLCMVVVKATAPGPVTLVASAEKLGEVKVAIKGMQD